VSFGPFNGAADAAALIGAVREIAASLVRRRQL